MTRGFNRQTMIDAANKKRLLSLDTLRGLDMAILVGIAGVIAGSRVLESMLYGVEATDPTTIAAVTLLLLAVVVAAMLIPAKRASRITPVDALRVE